MSAELPALETRSRVTLRSPVLSFGIRWFRYPQALAGTAILLVLVVLAVGAPVIAGHDPNEQFRGHRLESPSSEFFFGTDEFSRDLWARSLFGLRTSLVVGFAAVVMGAVVGAALGFLAGFLRGPVDVILSRLTDAMLAFPAIVIAIAIATALGRGGTSVAIALAVFNVPLFARLARAAALGEREKDYVLAASSLGAGPFRLLALHVVPNSLPPLIVQFAFSVSFALLLEAGLSFLGLGTQPPAPSIGGMLNASRTFMRETPWYAILPGTVMVLLLTAMNLIADALNDIADPRRRR